MPDVNDAAHAIDVIDVLDDSEKDALIGALKSMQHFNSDWEEIPLRCTVTTKHLWLVYVMTTLDLHGFFADGLMEFITDYPEFEEFEDSMTLLKDYMDQNRSEPWVNIFREHVAHDLSSLRLFMAGFQDYYKGAQEMASAIKSDIETTFFPDYDSLFKTDYNEYIDRFDEWYLTHYNKQYPLMDGVEPSDLDQEKWMFIEKTDLRYRHYQIAASFVTDMRRGSEAYFALAALAMCPMNDFIISVSPNDKIVPGSACDHEFLESDGVLTCIKCDSFILGNAEWGLHTPRMYTD